MLDKIFVALAQRSEYCDLRLKDIPDDTVIRKYWIEELARVKQCENILRAENRYFKPMTKEIING